MFVVLFVVYIFHIFSCLADCRYGFWHCVAYMWLHPFRVDFNEYSLINNETTSGFLFLYQPLHTSIT